MVEPVEEIEQGDDEEYEADIKPLVEHHSGQNGGKHINEYEIKEKLGEGSFARVRRVTRTFYDDDQQLTTADYGAKIMHKDSLANSRYIIYKENKESVMSNYLDQVYSEIEIWRRLNHKNLIKLYEVLDDPEDENLYLIMQLGNLGTLMKWNTDKLQYDWNDKIIEFVEERTDLKNKIFSNATRRLEAVAKEIFKQVIEGVIYLHNRKLVHRDIKLDNILCKADEAEFDKCFKLGDFTTAKKINDEMTPIYDIAGTIGYRSPELALSLEEGFLPIPCDVWSLGITIFAYITGKLPFYSPDSELETDLLAKNKNPDYPAEMSEDLKDLLEKMLSKEPLERPLPSEVLDHEWFKN